MEYLTGGSISKILQNFGSLQESVYKKYTRQVLEGVKYLHDRKVVHRFEHVYSSVRYTTV